MVRIMIVDDEPIVRVAFKSIVDWESNGFEVHMEASNGSEALEKLSNAQVDVVVTDIKMPVMNGIELIKDIRRLYSHIIVIVLSSYDDFMFVKEAFKLGAFDYILKQEMDEKKLAKLFEKVKQEWDNNKQELEQKEKNEEIIKNSKIFLISNFFKEIMLSNRNTEMQICRQIKKLNLRLNDENLIISVIKINNNIGAESNYVDNVLDLMTNSVINILEELFERFHLGNAFIINQGIFGAAYSIKNGRSEKAVRERVYNISQHILLSLKQYVNITATIGISSISFSGYSALNRLYNEACKAIEFSFIKGAGDVIFYNEIPQNTKNFSKFMDLKLLHLKEFLDYPEANKLPDLLTEICIKEQNISLADIPKVRTLYDKYAAVILEGCSHQKNSHLITSLIDEYFSTVKLNVTLSYLNKWLTAILRNICEEHDENYIVKASKQFINEHYNESISLSDVAEYLDVSKSHVSRIFTQGTGMSFMRYLIQVRIEKAKKYMRDGRLKVYEISERVGYSNSQYFCTVFKEVTGKTPKEYIGK